MDDLGKQLNIIAKDIQEIKLVNKEIQIAIGGSSCGSIGLSRRVEILEKRDAENQQLKWKIYGASAAIAAIMGTIAPLLFYLLEKL